MKLRQVEVVEAGTGKPLESLNIRNDSGSIQGKKRVGLILSYPH
jgi:hypothetical protein